jgi:hypothetical protein
MHVRPFQLLVAFSFCFATSASKYDGPDYESLPLDTVFPGPWESNIRAPLNKSHIVPVKIFNFEGAESVLQDASSSSISWVLSPGSLITFEFEENISGKCVIHGFLSEESC